MFYSLFLLSTELPENINYNSFVGKYLRLLLVYTSCVTEFRVVWVHLIYPSPGIPPQTPEETWDQSYPSPTRDMGPGIPTHPPTPVDCMTDTCENITCPQLCCKSIVLNEYTFLLVPVRGYNWRKYSVVF